MAVSTIDVLFVHVGNPLEPGAAETGLPVIEMDTLLQGRCVFLQKDVITNVTTRQHIAARDEVAVRSICFTDRKSPLRLLKSGLRLRRLARQHRVDLVHAYWGASSGLIVALFAPVSTIVTYGGSDLLGNYSAANKRTLSGRVAALLSQLAALFATCVVVPSERLKLVLWPVSRSKCRVIPQGVDPEKFYPMEYARACAFTRFAPDEKVVLFFPGNASWVKDPDLARATIEIVQDEIPEARLFYVTQVPHEDLVYYYNAAEALLITSHHEGSNNALKEAMCCNLPVVSTDVGDAWERLGAVTPSYVVPGRDPCELAARLIEILQRGLRSDAVAYVDQVSLAACTRQNVELYQAVVAR